MDVVTRWSAETTNAAPRPKVYQSSFRGGRAAMRGQTMRQPIETLRFKFS